MTQTTVHLALPALIADWEIGYLTAHLGSLDGGMTSSGFAVRTVGLTDAPVATMGGLRLLPDLTVADLSGLPSEESAMLVLPGAASWDDPAGLPSEESAMLVLPGAASWDDPANAPFVAEARRFVAAGVPVAAICGGTFALAAGGLLDDRPHTSNDPGYLAATGYAGGAHYVAEPVVDADGVITATGTRPLHFARAIFERLGAHDPQRLASWSKLYLDNDAAGFYELMSA